MRLQEFADAEKQIKLWKLISDSVWHSIKQQATEQEQKRATSQKKRSKKKPRPTTSKKPKTVRQPNLPSAQKSVSATKPTKSPKQQQKHLPPQVVKPQVLPLVFKSSTRSNRATPQHQSSTSQSQNSANTLQQRPMRQKHDPNSVANTQRQLDPFATNDVVKRLTR
jgi:hypothetical protein